MTTPVTTGPAVTRPRDDGGSAVVEFAVITPMLVLVVLAVVQIGLCLHVRALLQSAATEGARVAAVSGGSAALAEGRIRNALSHSLADGVVSSVTVHRAVVAGMPDMEVTVVARLPLVGLLGPTSLVVHGHAMAEP